MIDMLKIVLRFSVWALICPAISQADEQKPEPADIAEYRQFALRNPGDGGRGKKLFEGDKLQCGKCHGIGADQRHAGPDLLGIADKYDRARLVESILKPRASILAGYATVNVTTKAGVVHTGIVRNRDATELELWIAEGKRQSIPAAEIEEEQASDTSLMPEALHRLVGTDDFADLIAYLEQLKDPKLSRYASEGTPDNIPALAKPIRLEPFHDAEHRFVHPVWFAPVPGLEGGYVIVENDPGKIWLLEKTTDGTQKTLFLDIKDEIHTGQHMGLMGLAFHPRFQENRKYYLDHHFKFNGAFGTYIVERFATEDYRRDAGVTSRLVLRIDQWTELHTGGMVGFGPDNYLYIGTGDGGPQTDPEGHAQDLHLLLGAVLRIDVDNRDPGLEYAIPKSNPFHGHADPDVRQEIWTRGLRQAWRFSWDSLTHDLWVGDVGQVGFEEVTIIRAGESHGWNVYEGFLPFSDRFHEKGVQHVPPVVALGRKHGASITGGYVYRGQKSPSYNGVYIFGDYESKRIWGLTQKDRNLIKIREIGMAPDRITSFAVDDDGEIYMLGYDQGFVHRLVLDDSVFE